jgi:DnaK suppressor protein
MVFFAMTYRIILGKIYMAHASHYQGSREAVTGKEANTMRPEQVLKFKAMFEQERRNLVYTQEIVNEEFYVQADDLLDPTDLTTTELETSMRMRLRNREALYLKKIENALRRISEGTFNECEGCGNEIGEKRLVARPTTTFCIGCKEDREQKEQHHIDGHHHKSLGSRIRFA